MNLMEVDLPNEIKVETDLNTDSSLRDFDEKPFQYAYYDSENINNKVDDQVEVQSSFGGVEYVYDLHTGEHFFKPEFVVPEDLNMKVDRQEMGQPYTEELLNVSLKTYVKSEPTTSESEAGKPLSHLQNSKFNGGKIKEESFAETAFLIQQEVNIKSKDEESDQSDTKPAKGETEKLRHRSNKSDSLNGFNLINTSSHQLHLDEPPVFSCSNCSYQTHQQRNLNRHVAKHMEMTFKCPHCPYQTCYSSGLKRHKLVHASKEEVELHKCPECPFTSKWKKAVTKHLLMHKSLNEITWYQCPDCPFKTKHKRNLINRHMFIHRKELGHENPDKWFSCALCPFKTPYRSAVNKHALVHKNDSDIEWFQCSECSFKAKQKSNFIQHKLIHNQVVEKQFECSECCYKTAIAAYYRRHLLKHKDPDSETWFKCFNCSYKTTRKNNLRKHTYTHKLI